MDIWIKYLVNSLLIKDMIVLTVWQQQLPGIWLPLQAFVRCNVEKNNRHHHKICNGFTGYKGTCIGFNGNCNGPCWSLLVIVQLTLNKIINATLFCFCPIFHELNSKIWDFFYVHKRPISLKYCSQICLNLLVIIHIFTFALMYSGIVFYENDTWDASFEFDLYEVAYFLAQLLPQFKCCLRGQLIRPWNRATNPTMFICTA